MPLIKPPEYEAVPLSVPFVLLFGPRKGATDWEGPTARWFLDREPDICVASTRSDEWSVLLTEVQRRRCIKQQREWVKLYIELVLERMVNRKRDEAPGVMMIWCPKEENLDLVRNYAPTTRFVAGQISGWVSGARGRTIFEYPEELPDGLFIGADEGFGGRRDLEDALSMHGRPLYSSLDTMQDETLGYLRRK